VDVSSQNNPGEYYVARIETTQKALVMLKDNEMLPGMPVEVIVKGGERSFMSYVLKPLTDSFATAFLN
jgi:protease secretion system membrane fusion protein